MLKQKNFMIPLLLFPNNFIFHSYETLYSSRKVLQFADYIYDYVSDDGAVYPVACAGMEEKLPAAASTLNRPSEDIFLFILTFLSIYISIVLNMK